MPRSRNDAIWNVTPDKECLVPHSVLRTRSFWRTLYRLNIDQPGGLQPGGWRVESHRFDFWDGFFVSVQSAQSESLLFIGGHEAARLDESVTMPHLFMWAEIRAIARHFEARQDSPTNPSVATLLLAPFLAITAVEEDTVRPELAFQLESLDLLEPNEIAEIINGRCIPDTDWVASPDVGWTLRWVKDGSVTALNDFSPIYSERRAGAEFGPRLLELLRAANSGKST